MKLKGKKIAILLEQMYQDLEAWYPYYRLKEEGAEVKFIAPKTDEEYLGKYGYPAKADLKIDDAHADDFDAVIIPGGFAPDFMRREPKMIDFVRQMNAKGKLVASICHGGWILASADIVRNKKVTTFFAIKDDLINAGANYVDEEVVRDGNLITSRQPEDLPAFVKAIIDFLSREK